MRRWLAVFLFVLFAAGAFASPLDSDTKPLAKPRVPGRPATAAEVEAAKLQGGDTFVDALPITAVPFTDSGTTIGYTDDYDNDCFTGVSGSAPDVVYAFTAPATGSYSFSLCGSAYDTKLYVYDNNGSLLACNDDYEMNQALGDPCYWDSRIDRFPATGGAVYYLVVDGFADSAGEYTLTVDSAASCDVPAPGSILQEGEPALVFGQDDAYNCGCTCVGNFAQQVLTADPTGRVVLDTVQGWRDVGLRDRDWFRLTAGTGGTVHVEFESEVAAEVAIYANAVCANLDGAPTVLVVNPCQPGSVDVLLGPGAEFYVETVAIQEISPLGMVPESYDAVLTVSGLATGVSVSPATWGDVKSLYR